MRIINKLRKKRLGHSSLVQELNTPVSVHESKRIENSKSYFDSIKGIHAGRRAFVVGNGPSLRMSDLEKIEGEISIASNKIYLAFPNVNWRPSYYVVADDLVWNKIRNIIPTELYPVLIPHYLESDDSVPCQTFRTLRFSGLQREMGKSLDLVEFSTDIGNGLYGTCTVTFENLQIAAHLGCNPIYIIGCDHKYIGEVNVIRDNVIPHGSTSNHFIENYRREGELVNPAPIEIMNRGYREARIFSDSQSVKIYNATRGGCLDAFERIDFDSLF